MESNDSPEIPDRGETSDIPGLPSGARKDNLLPCIMTDSSSKSDKVLLLFAALVMGLELA